MKVALRILIGLVALLGVGSLVIAQESSESGRPPPPQNPPDRLKERQAHPEAEVFFDPPPDSLEPTVSGDEAYDIAWEEEAAPSRPREAQATLALLTHPYFALTRAPVWIVEYYDVCDPTNYSFAYVESYVKEHGTPPPPCDGLTTWTVVLDATTGRFLMSYN